MSWKKCSLCSALKNWKRIPPPSRKQVVRGMIGYSISWPCACAIQQLIDGREEFDYKDIMRYSLFGGLYVAPVLSVWLTIARSLWPGNTLRARLTKVFVEQVTYTPFAQVGFYFGMTLLQMKGVEAAIQEVKDKFWATYKVAILWWPLVQMTNFTFIKEKNHIAFMSVASFVWAVFMAHVKAMRASELKHEGVFGSMLTKRTI